jgi:hypothetical protein
LEFAKNRKAVPIVRDGKKAITTADTMSSDGIQVRLDNAGVLPGKSAAENRTLLSINTFILNPHL